MISAEMKMTSNPKAIPNERRQLDQSPGAIVAVAPKRRAGKQKSSARVASTLLCSGLINRTRPAKTPSKMTKATGTSALRITDSDDMRLA